MEYYKKIRQYLGHDPILTAGAVLIVLNENKEILLQLRSDFKKWGVIGGGMEIGETMEETAKRELEEETGLLADSLELVDLVSGPETYRIYPNGDKVYDVTAIYMVTKYHGNLKINDDESLELKWFDVTSKVEDDMPDFMKNYWRRIKNIIEKRYKN